MQHPEEARSPWAPQLHYPEQEAAKSHFNRFQDAAFLRSSRLPGFMQTLPRLSRAAMACVASLACSDEANFSTPATQSSAVQLSPDQELDESDGCSIESEAQLITLNVTMADGEARIAITNTVESAIEGTVDVKVTTQRGSSSQLLPFAVAGFGSQELSLSFASIGVDAEIELAELAVGLTGTVSGGTRTFATASTIFDVRAEKPEEQEPPPEGTLMERVAVAYVTDGISDDRLGADDGDSGGAVEKVLVPNKTLCFDASFTLASGGIGEDVWPSLNRTEWARAQRIDFKPPGSSTWSTWWLSASGCITANMDSGGWQFRAYSRTRIAINGGWSNINVTADGTTDYAAQFTATLNTATSQTVTYTPFASVTVVHLVHQALYPNRLWLTSKTLGPTIDVRANAASSVANATQIRLAAADLTDKFVVAHEVGHYVYDNELNTSLPADYTLNVGSCSQGNSHTVTSREFNSAAHLEGEASYWAALTFNDRSQSNCWTRFTSTNIPCAGGNPTLPLRYMETQCVGGGAFTGHGNETDWQRTFWDLTRGDTGGTVPTPLEVFQFASTGTGWSINNHWFRLDVASNLASTPSYLETRWDNAVTANGIYF